MATETLLSLWLPKGTSQGAFEVWWRQTGVSSGKVEALECSIVANTALKQISVYLVDVGLTHDSHAENKGKRPRDGGISVTHRCNNRISVSYDLISVGRLLETQG